MMRDPLGVVLAGGESRRYGSPKALATVAGRRIVDRVVAALLEVTPTVAVSANEPDLFDDLGLAIHPDVRPGLGALGGILTTLRIAGEEGRPGILAVACDMPFPCVPLLERLRSAAFGGAAGATPAGAGDRAGPDGRADLAIPESRGRRGVEPLFAAYGVGCVPAIEAALAAGDRRVIGFHGAVSVRRIPLAEVESLCDPERAFMNVNTPGERDRAETLAREGG